MTKDTDMTEQSELRPLPCGNCRAPARWVKLARRIKCTRPSCGVEGGRFETQTAAIAAWNTRSQPSPDVVEAGVVALEKAAKVFAHYGDLHKAKSSKEGDQKAAVNIAYSMEFGEAADDLRKALATQPSDDVRELLKGPNMIAGYRHWEAKQESDTCAFDLTREEVENLIDHIDSVLARIDARLNGEG